MSDIDLTPKKDFGLQPLDEIMKGRGIFNHDLVRVSTRQLTHKMVQKGRLGRRLTTNARMKILIALNTLSTDRKYTSKEVFNYLP